jgi:NAD(P)-dependent dehydrogenase (short-subunit alcohol dehydrogenase family)
MTDDYQNEKGHYDGLVSYGRAKRIQVYLAEYWTKKYSNTGITFNTVHPGKTFSIGLN